MNLPFVNPTAEDIHAIEIARCKFDCEYFIEEYVKIEDRDAPEIAIKFSLWDRQKQVLKKILSKRLLQILKARQLGLTWMALAYAVWGLLHKPGYSVLALSKREDDAKELVRRVSFILRYLPRWFLPEERWKTTTENIKIFNFDDKGTPLEDSVFQSFPAAQDSGRSFTANLVILDEWAFQQWAREIWKAAFPSINRSTGGQVIGLSTIERGTLFEEMWRDKDSAFEKIFLPWFTDPRRDQKWYDNTIRAIKGEVSSEYPATEEEALSIPGGTYFHEFNTLIHVKQPLPQVPSWYSKYRVMDYGLDTFACYFVYVDGQGYGRIYKEIYEPNLVISAAAYLLLKESGADVPDTAQKWDSLKKEDKKIIGLTSKEKFLCTFAPPDLFAKSNQTGKSSDEVWYENGVQLTKSKNDFEQGCIAVADWLHPFLIKEEQSGEEYFTARLTIDRDSAPNLVYSLANIQKDKYRPAVYSKTPHSLTHSPDALRYFCTEMSVVPINEEEEKLRKQRKLYETAYPQDLMEDEIVSDPDLIM
ncbi:MAG: hypothetical protein WC998_05130 [Candidatus Paceibacterota bacterium]|jgi:hypothetical protein